MPFRAPSTLSRLPFRILAGLAFLVALVVNILAVGRTLNGLVQDDIPTCLLASVLAMATSLTLPVFWTIARPRTARR